MSVVSEDFAVSSGRRPGEPPDSMRHGITVAPSDDPYYVPTGGASGPDAREAKGAVNVLIVDDHPLIREGLANVLRELDDHLHVLEAESGEAAMTTLRQPGELTLILLDLLLPGASGMSLLRQVREERPDVPVVVLSASDGPHTVRQAIDCGAMGFISKRSSTPILVSALRLVLAGAVYIPPQALAAEDTAEPAAAATPPGRGSTPPGMRNMTMAELGLTGRQSEVLTLLVQGKPNKIICRELGLAEGTIKTHIAAILKTLNVSSRTQAVFVLSKLGIQLPSVLKTRGAAAVPESNAEDQG
jgi:DNA-binding NarL/FixJ family response regulator